MTNQQKLKKLFARLDEIQAYGRAIGKLSFDMECCAPEEGIQKAGEDMAVLGKQIHKLTHDKRFEALICELHADSEGLTPVQKKAIEHLYEDWSKSKNIDAKLSYEMDLASNRAYGAWLSAKKANDFSLFRDALADLIRYNKIRIDLRDEKKDSTYNTCLDDYEKGGSIQQLDAFFAALKGRIVPLLNRIVTEGKPIREDFMSRPVPIPRQEAMSKYLLELEGLRQRALVLMTTEHAFTTNFGKLRQSRRACDHPLSRGQLHLQCVHHPARGRPRPVHAERAPGAARQPLRQQHDQRHARDHLPLL